MAGKKGVSSKTHTKAQLDNYANQHIIRHMSVCDTYENAYYFTF